MMCLGEAGGGGLLELSLGDLLGSGVEVAEVEDSPENSALRIIATLMIFTSATQFHNNFTYRGLTPVPI